VIVDVPKKKLQPQKQEMSDSEEEELTLMGNIKAGKDGKPTKKSKIKKKKALSEEQREKMHHVEEVKLFLIINSVFGSNVKPETNSANSP
jgi:hypothetical protein